jgi:hypothetical protein
MKTDPCYNTAIKQNTQAVYKECSKIKLQISNSGKVYEWVHRFHYSLLIVQSVHLVIFITIRTFASHRGFSR